MLALLVWLQWPYRQVRVAVSKSDYLEEPVLEGKALHCHPESVCLHQVDPKCAACLAFHAHCLVHIGTEAHTVKELHQCIKIPLEAGFPRLQNKPAVWLEVRHQILHVPPKTLHASRSRGGSPPTPPPQWPSDGVMHLQQLWNCIGLADPCAL